MSNATLTRYSVASFPLISHSAVLRLLHPVLWIACFWPQVDLYVEVIMENGGVGTVSQFGNLHQERWSGNTRVITLPLHSTLMVS